MEKSATNVARPSIPGGELPSFDELLAKGSFHARLARARVEREKALAEAGDDDAEDFILNTSRKPWDRQKTGPAKADRLSTAFEASVAMESAGRVAPAGRKAPTPGTPGPRVVALRADRPAKASVSTPSVASAPAGRGLLTLPSIRPVEAPAKITPTPRKRTLMVAGGFAAGMAIGIAATMLLPRFPLSFAGLRPGAQPSLSVHEPVSLPAVGPLAVAETADLDAPALAAAPAPLTRPASPVAPEADRSPGLTALATDSTAARVTLGPLLEMTRPDGAEPARIPAPGSGPAVPAPGALVLAATTGADALPVAAPAATRPLVGAGDGPISAAPLETPPPGWQVLPPQSDPGVGPAVTGVLLALARPDAALTEQPVPPAFVPQFDGHVVINAPDSVADAELSGIVDGLGAAGFALSEPNRVSFTVKGSNVRYFHAEDADAAAALAGTIGAIARDFTSFSPVPPVGTLEVWLAGSGTGTAAPTKSRSKATQRSAADQRLLDLRNRILRQLRNGDHL